MTFLIRDAKVAEEIAAQAGTEETPPFELSNLISPVIFGPQRPPLAASGYFPGCIGLSVNAVALNFSNMGLFVSGTNVDSIVRVNSITIMNTTGGSLAYTIRRLDDATGFSLVAAIPGYINAGNPNSGGVFSATRSNLTTRSGTQMAFAQVAAGSAEHFEGPWIVNNGAVIVSPNNVNTPMFAYMSYEHWPSIRPQ